MSKKKSVLQLEVSIEKDEHLHCWGRDCESDHWQNNIHLKSGGVELVVLEGSEFYVNLVHVLSELEDCEKPGVKLIKTGSQCKCGEKFYIQKMLTELEIGIMKCEHNNKPL